MDSSSDSSSEDTKNLREALDQSMFCSKNATNSQSKHSLRDQKTEDSNYKNNILNVTPEFQHFVAQRLSKLLDKSIKECHKDVDLTVPKCSGGIRLFKESKRLLKDRKFIDPFDSNAVTDAVIHSVKKKKCYREISQEESEMLENAKAVAVSPSWILDKKETVSWSKPKGDVFVYKKNKDNQLERVDHSS